MTPWEFQATEFTNCNCAYGCPCQFDALPTYGDCKASSAMVISKGRFGDVVLDGLKAVLVMAWPGPIHEGSGKAFIIIDERASEEQRNALLTIFSGAETEPGKTIFNVFAATFDEVFDPQFSKIDIEIDVEKRLGRVVVDGFIDMAGTPIRNATTGAEHRAQICLPDGFEYLVAEMGSGTSKISGPVPMEFSDSYGQFANIHLSQSGAVKPAA